MYVLPLPHMPCDSSHPAPCNVSSETIKVMHRVFLTSNFFKSFHHQFQGGDRKFVLIDVGFRNFV
jgi:hypothetical protein